MNPQPTMTPPSRPGWWKRNWKWFVPVSLLGVLLVGVGLIALIVTMVMGSVKSSVPYTRAMAQAKDNPALIAEMGSPIEAGWYVSGSIKTTGPNSYADFYIPINGPKGSGTLHVIALKSPFAAGTEDWKITLLEAKVDGRSEVIALSGDDTPLPVALTQDTSDAPQSGPPSEERETAPRESGIAQGVPGGVSGGSPDEAPPPPPPGSGKNLKTISGGVLNGRAISLPKPSYPSLAKAAGVRGTVTVQVLVDENGNVVSATAVSGHPLLRATAEQAARGARFTPTKLTGQAVKVSGVITYNFTQ